MGMTSIEARRLVSSYAARSRGLRLQQQNLLSINVANVLKSEVAHIWNLISANIVQRATLKEFRCILHRWLFDTDQTLCD